MAGTVRMAGGTGNSGSAQMSSCDVERGLLGVRKAKMGVLRGDGRYFIPKSGPRMRAKKERERRGRGGGGGGAFSTAA